MENDEEVEEEDEEARKQRVDDQIQRRVVSPNVSPTAAENTETLLPFLHAWMKNYLW